MLNFKKLFSIRIISLVVTFAFLFQSTIYGIDLPKGSNLRVPLMNASGDSTRRLIETLSKVTYHEHVNEHIATQAESQYKSFLQSRDIALDLAGDVENIAIFYDSLEKYPGSEIAILEIEGLYGNARVLEHIGLGLFYGRPIIYIDSSLKGQERQEILQHAYDEVTKWEEKRLSLGLEFFQMRQHILDHYEEFEAFADSSHRASHNVDHILEKYKARHKGDLLDAVAMMPFKEGDVVIAAGTLSRRDFGKLMGASLLAYVLAACGVNPDAPTETTPSETVPSEDLSSYMIPGIDLIPDDKAEGYVKERLWSHPENVRALTDASYHFNVPRVLAVSVLGPEIFAMQSGARRSAEDVVSSLHKYDTFSEGIAQLQVRHAVRFFPALYEDATSPGAPLYLRDTIEPYAYLYGSIGDRDDDGALIHFQEIKELLKNDILCIYMMTMYIRESMEILHRADPSFRDPNTFDALSIPTAFEASAIGSYYVYGPAHALNPNATSVWNEVVGSHISTPKYNIYIIRVRQDGWDWLEMDKYLKQSAISMDYSGHSTFSDVMYGIDGWLDSHGSPYDEGLFGVFLDNADLRYAQSLPPQYAYLARMFAHSNVYGFNVPYSYPNNWQAIQAPATPTPISPPTEVPPSFPVGDLPEGFNSDAQGIFYTVQSGDNLWSIATTVYEDMNYLYPDAIDINSVLSIIVSLNDIPDSAVIDIGQKIYVYSFLNSNAGSMRRYSMMPAGLGLAMTRIRAPSVGHVEPVADAYTALQAGKHDEAYDLVMEGLLGEDFVVNIETAIGILRRLLIYYGIDTEKGKTIAAMSPVVAKHKRAVDQTAMKKELAGVISKVRLRGIYRYRPGFTFRMWGQAKRAVYEKFETTAERKEALQHIRILARKLAEKKLDSRNALENAIPAAVGAAENIDAFKLFIELGINLAERGIDPTPSLQRGTTAIAGAAGNREELDLFMDLATTLAENIIDPVATLTHAIPAIAKAANDTEEIRLFIDLGIKLVENGIEPYQVLTSVVPTLASTASNIQELRLFIDLGIKLAENNIDPAPVLEYGIPASAKVAKDIEELGLFIGLGIKLAENAIEPSLALLYAIPATARVASDKDELKLFIDLGATLAENGIDPTLTLQYSIPATARVASNKDELKLFIDLGATLAENGIDPTLTLQYGAPALAKVASNMEDMRLFTDLGIELAINGIDPHYVLRYALSSDAALEMPRPMRVLLGATGVPHYDDAVVVLNTLINRYGAETQKGRHIRTILDIVTAVNFNEVKQTVILFSGDEVEDNPDSFSERAAKDRDSRNEQGRFAELPGKSPEYMRDFVATYYRDKPFTVAQYIKDWETANPGRRLPHSTAYSDLSKARANGWIEESEERYHYRLSERGHIDLGELMRYSSIGGSALSHELVFNIKGSDSKDPRVARDEDLRNMQVIAVESTLDPEFFGEGHTTHTLLLIDTEEDEVVGYSGVTIQGDRIIEGSSKVFDSFRNHGYMERAVKLLLSSRQIEEWFSSQSLEKPAERMYQRIREDSRFIVTSVRPSGYLVRLKAEQVAMSELQQTVVLFSGDEVQANLDGFKQALDELDDNNTAVVIVDSEEQQRFCIEHRGELGRFYIRTPEQLGLAGFDSEQVMITIMGIDNLQCIPLTDSLCDSYEALKRARDKV